MITYIQWHGIRQKKNYRLSEILLLDNLIKNNKNLDAILNYPRPPRNYQYYE